MYELLSTNDASAQLRQWDMPGHRLADGSEVRPSLGVDARTIGFMAGASAPESSVGEMSRALRQPVLVDLATMEGRRERGAYPLPVVAETVR
ncbi:hypothetical protein [Dyella telluris]|uniref:Uncharacterized protein n=1 Tax=Dyella telluris TaxID=2763498 RepID=A0A7G8Q315_9GAMM|nr:hypothetical protein [Dyella telluris]QNK01173.1 hypothetical protein H8F01_19270 [Dyella telluris]